MKLFVHTLVLAATVLAGHSAFATSICESDTYSDAELNAVAHTVVSSAQAVINEEARNGVVLDVKTARYAKRIAPSVGSGDLESLGGSSCGVLSVTGSSVDKTCSISAQISKSSSVIDEDGGRLAGPKVHRIDLNCSQVDRISGRRNVFDRHFKIVTENTRDLARGGFETSAYGQVFNGRKGSMIRKYTPTAFNGTQTSYRIDVSFRPDFQ